MNNTLLTISLPTIGINIILFLFTLFIHESGHHLYRLKFTYFPNQKKVISPDAFGTFLIPLFSIFSSSAAAGYSRINKEDHYLDNSKMVKVLIAGPLANLIIFSLLLIFIKILYSVNAFNDNSLSIFIKNFLVYFCTVQLMFVIVNFIPIPPLDAGQFLMKTLNVKGEKFGIIGGFTILILVYLGIIKWLSEYIFNIVNLLAFNSNYFIFIPLSLITLTGVSYFIFPYNFSNKKSKTDSENILQEKNKEYISDIVNNLIKTQDVDCIIHVNTSSDNTIPDNKSGIFSENSSGDYDNSPFDNKKFRFKNTRQLKTLNKDNYLQVQEKQKDIIIVEKEPEQTELNLKSQKLTAKKLLKKLKNKPDIIETTFIEMQDLEYREKTHYLKIEPAKKDKIHTNKVEILVNKIIDNEILNENEIFLYRRIKKLNFSIKDICEETLFKISDTKCKLCLNYNTCLSRAFADVDLRNTSELNNII